MNIKKIVLSLFVIASFQPIAAQVHKPAPTDTPTSMMEKLDRGLVVINTAVSGKYFVSWRYLGTDDTGTSFTLLKDGEPYKSNILNATSLSVGGTATTQWQVVTLHNGVAVDTTAAATPWGSVYKSIKLDRPASGSDYAYTPNDCSVGDVDGDGQYELFVKWDPTNSKDNSQSGITGDVYIDCYKLDGTKLWRVDLGKNIRAGAHYTQFLVYDFDRDGKAEMICKTAPGTIDGTGNYVNLAATDAAIKSQDNTMVYRDSYGRIMSGPEYLTVFNGLTGAAIHTIYYNPNRAGTFNQVGAYPDKSFWGDSYANRSERYNATVAYLDGADANPSAVMCRGYYTRSYVWAVDFDGKQLSTKWLHASVSKSEVDLYGPALTQKTVYTYNKNTYNVNDSYTCYGQGPHNISVGDVDGDGKDEICFGSAAVDNDGKLLYSTGLGHGDAQHLGDFDPDRPGYEYFMVHEDSPWGYDLRDAATGEKILWKTGTRDTGRGLIADIDPAYRGCEFTYATQTGTYDIKGNKIAGIDGSYAQTMGMNFRIFWDGDPYEEMEDGTSISKWTGSGSREFTIGRSAVGSYGNSTSCNGTKATPNLQCDLFGDWREELVLWDSTDSCTLNIFSTTEPTDYRVPCLMQDHMYRMGIAWQNNGYNQPPHLGYYLPDYINTFQGVDTSTGINDLSLSGGASIVKTDYYDLQGVKVNKYLLTPGVYILRMMDSKGNITTRKILKQ